MKPIFYTLLILLCLFSSCTSSNVEEDFPPPPCMITTATYSGDVQTIIRKYCYSCHGTDTRFGGVFLERYSDVADYANSGALKGVMRAIDGYNLMPDNNVIMLECDILKVEQWIAEGAENN